MDTTKRPYKLAASLVCANMLNIEQEVMALEKGQIDYIHFDVMDGVFVPRYGMHPEMLQAVRSITGIPVDVHMMVADPEPYIKDFAAAGANIIAVHAESTAHLHRVIMRIKEAGVKAGVAINPATPLDVLKYVLDDIELVVLMAINPGILGHKLIPNQMDKIAELKAMIGDRNIMIEIDGGVTFETGPKMVDLGADLLVCGSSTIYKRFASVEERIAAFRETLDSTIKR